MNERIKKLEQKAAELRAQMAASLAAADAEGVSAEDKAKHVAAFDLAEASLKDVQQDLARSVKLLDAETEAARHQQAMSQPQGGTPNVRPTIVGHPSATGRTTVPATPRRHGVLKAHKGPDAVARAERAGMWAAATLYGNERARQWCAAHGVTTERGTLEPQATLNTSDNAGAGYLVPDEVEYTIAELAEQYGVLRRYAEVVPMSSGTKSSPRWTKGMTAYWIAEGAKPTATDPAWDMIQLVAKDMGAMTKMSRQLDEDSVVDLGDKVTMCIAEAFFLAEDDAGFNGTGTLAFGGVTGLTVKVDIAAARHVAASGNVTPETLDVDDFNQVVAKYPNWTAANPAWFMHKAVWANACQRLQLAAGGTLPQDIANGGMPMFLGYPVVWVNVMPKAPTANAIAALFGDLSLSTKLGSRRGRTVDVGYENDDFTKQLMTILGTQRVDIVNHTITDPRNASNPGPVMGLKLAAS